jgi:hypothetical protein
MQEGIGGVTDRNPREAIEKLKLRYGLDETIKKYFSCQMAIVQVKLGETAEEAWRRHLTEHPEDIAANIKVFNSPDRAALGLGSVAEQPSHCAKRPPSHSRREGSYAAT